MFQSTGRHEEVSVSLFEGSLLSLPSATISFHLAANYEN